ncbi:MAG: hypothetical protein U5L00_11680 [Desulfovermiculus sp.]|nr:hypothetical protein [Desulfovermiculus sp.]
MDEIDERGRSITAETMLMLVNSSGWPVDFMLPSYTNRDQWHLELDTRYEEGLPGSPGIYTSGTAYSLMEHSLALFRLMST